MCLQKFAGEGLRTLVLAERHIDEDFFLAWRSRQQEAALSLDGREDKLGAIYEEIECDLQLVGVTAIEDKLQDGVPQTIANLQMAGIKVWVLTGDKQGKKGKKKIGIFFIENFFVCAQKRPLILATRANCLPTSWSMCSLSMVKHWTKLNSNCENSKNPSKS